MSILLVVSLANIFFRIQAIQSLLAVVFAGIYMVYIIVDTQMIMGGSGRRFKLTLDDYIMGTMILYMDIVGLFLKLLQLLGEKKRKD
jgi:FtsH-binding integral membrane protein